MTELTFVRSPARLPPAPLFGRVATVDLAFAAGLDFDRVTKPFIDELGSSLALWVDHHDHPAWSDFASDDRFVLQSKMSAPACPELVTEALVERIGAVDHVLAHADFDGCIAATKLLMGGKAPYPEADLDARAIDAPGHGYECTPDGFILALAIDRVASGSPERYLEFLEDVSRALVRGGLAEALTDEVRTLAKETQARFDELMPMVDKARRPHPDVLVLEIEQGLSGSDKKALLRLMEERATVAIIEEKKHTIFATYHDDRLDLSLLPGVKGGRGYVWGEVRADDLLPKLARLLQDE